MMKYTVRMTATAKQDLKDIAFYIIENTKERTVAKRFVAALREECAKLQDFPEIGAWPKDHVLRSAGYRYLVCKNYLIFYTVNKTQMTVDIAAIFNAKKDYQRVMRTLL